MAPKLTEVALPFQFQPNKWYHVVITHSTGSALSSSVVRMFVDGNLEASSRFKYIKVCLSSVDCPLCVSLSGFAVTKGPSCAESCLFSFWGQCQTDVTPAGNSCLLPFLPGTCCLSFMP